MDTEDEVSRSLPDLPGLESVEVKRRGHHVFASLALLLVAGFMGLGVQTYHMLGDYANALLPPIIFGAVVAGGLCLWIIHRLLLGDFHWRTSAEGLYSRSLIRSRFRSWTNMLVPTAIAGKQPGRSELVAIDASVWQHLRRQEKTDERALSKAALTFWDIIPDELPQVLDWRNPRQVRRSYTVWCAIAGLLLAAGLGLVASLYFGLLVGDAGFWIGISLMYALLAAQQALLQKMQPEYISLNGEKMQARFIGKTLDLSPDDITHAWWSGPLLQVRTAKAHFAIPLDSVYDQSSMMILALIRWLRLATLPKLMLVPEDLRSTPRSTPRRPDIECNTDDEVEVPLATVDKVAFVVLADIFSLLFARLGVQGARVLLGAAVLVTVAAIVSALVWCAAASYTLSIDSSGITKSFLWWKRTVRWSEVADYSLGSKAGTSTLSTATRCVLRSPEGRDLISFAMSWTSAKAPWELFKCTLFSRLAEILPDEKSQKPWKARPYDSPSPN